MIALFVRLTDALAVMARVATMALASASLILPGARAADVGMPAAGGMGGAGVP